MSTTLKGSLKVFSRDKELDRQHDSLIRCQDSGVANINGVVCINRTGNIILNLSKLLK